MKPLRYHGPNRAACELLLHPETHADLPPDDATFFLNIERVTDHGVLFVGRRGLLPWRHASVAEALEALAPEHYPWGPGDPHEPQWYCGFRGIHRNPLRHPHSLHPRMNTSARWRARLLALLTVGPATLSAVGSIVEEVYPGLPWAIGPRAELFPGRSQTESAWEWNPGERYRASMRALDSLGFDPEGRGPYDPKIITVTFHWPLKYTP